MLVQNIVLRRTLNQVKRNIRQILVCDKQLCVLYNIHKRQCSNSPQTQSSSTSLEQGGDLALFPNPSVDNMFVPKCNPASIEDIRQLQEFVRKCKKLLVLTGK